ncbi:inosine/xanthosine triphosphatase [bacterium]|nr:inosine/xanthosine triphosphatase [bacterium]
MQEIPVQKIVVASKNPTKIQGTLDGFQSMFPNMDFLMDAVAGASDVPEQPIGDTETLAGAYNRARSAREKKSEADFWVGIESGVTEHATGLAVFSWIVIFDKNRVGQSRTNTFFLPPRIAELVRNGQSLGDANDAVFQRTNTRQESGASGLLTGDVITRRGLYHQAVIYALIPFKNPELFPPSE